MERRGSDELEQDDLVKKTYHQRDKSKGASKMKIWQAYFHASVIAFSAWLCWETIFEALQWWNGSPPLDGLFLGSYILLTGVACISIVAIHFPHVQVNSHNDFQLVSSSTVAIMQRRKGSF